MNLKTFFKKFDTFADAPNAVAKMRELVLHLAVTGRLVPQDPEDEPADELIARIGAMRRAKKAKEYGPVTTDEVPHEVPASWSWIRLGAISLTSDSGWSPQCLPEARLGEDWGVLKVSAVSWGVFKPEENKALPPGMASRPDCEVKAGDFLLSRANTEQLVARSVVVEQTPPRLMMSDKIVRFTFPDEIERTYINLANTSDPSRVYYARNASGTSSSMKNIGREVMSNLPIPLPPLAEQKRIVAKVDELMALCDRLETQQQELQTRHAALARASLARFADAPTPANLRFIFHPSYTISPADLRKSILTLAVQGKLVPQSPRDELVKKLCERVKVSRRKYWCEMEMAKMAAREIVPQNDDWKRRFKDVAALDSRGLPPIPESWQWISVAEAGEVQLGRQRAPRYHRGPNMRPYLRVQNVYENRIDVSDLNHMDFSPIDHIVFHLRDGDVLLNEGQSFKLVGRPAIYRDEVPGACFQNTLIRFRPYSPLRPEFALLVFRSYMHSGRFQSISQQTTNIAHLSAGRFAQLEFPLPPLAEQRRIVAKVDQLMALVDQLETQLAAAQTESLLLLEAVLHEVLAPTSAPS